MNIIEYILPLKSSISLAPTEKWPKGISATQPALN